MKLRLNKIAILSESGKQYVSRQQYLESIPTGAYSQ